MFPYGTSGERVDTLICFLCCGYFLTPLSLCATFPIFCVATPRKAGHGKGEGLEDSGCLRLKSVFLIV